MSLEPKSKVIKISSLSVVELKEMHEVFGKYYRNADLETFFLDINKKQYVLLMTDRDDGRIIGFSTIALMDLDYGGKKVIGFFSGDTILEKEYWGSRRWQLTWALFFFRIKLANPLTPIFWLLISKGYKTYLLLANNFTNYYPKVDGNDPRLEKVVDFYCDELYSEYYIKEDKILDFGGQYQSLQEGVAEICDDLKEGSPKIEYFEKRNPNWRQGTELPCVGIMEFSALVNFVKKIAKEKLSRIRRSGIQNDIRSV